jgi:RNA polymerase sigma-54 factor
LAQDQKQVQKLSPVMRQSLEILQMSTHDLCELIKKECTKNPTIEVDDRRQNFVYDGKNKSDAHQEFLENISREPSLEDHLLDQVVEWSAKDKKVLSKILENLNERGFFDGDLLKIAEVLQIPLAEVEYVHTELKSLHPHGIGAKNIQECLLLQLAQCAGNEIELATTLVRDYFHELQKGRVDFLCRKLKLPYNKIVHAAKLIAGLNFNPISGFSNEKSVTIIPDLRIHKSDGEWLIDFNSENVPTIRFSRLYREIACNNAELDGKTWKYLRQQAQSGTRLLKAIDRRQMTLSAIAEAILCHQMDFFEHGPEFMRPLRLQDIATETDLHTSTVSRAVRGKYVDTPHGTFEMSKFFDGGSGYNSFSQGAILEMIRKIINSSKKRLPDAEISRILAVKGIKVARRTVSKYRQLMNLPNSRQILLSAPR